jgi:FkbM family methyltransferase
MRNRDSVIQKGSGKGLQFNAGSSNAGYVLGTTEGSLQEALRLVLRPGATFYDVGANVGFLAVIGARLVGPSGLVHAFEPLPENVRWLRHNIALNGSPNVTVHAVALGKADGTADFHIGEDPNWGSLASPADGHEAMAVQVRRLDSLVTEGLPAPQVMKIDIEGGEIDMLLSAAGTLRAARPLLFIDLHGTNAGVADVLEPLDYDLHVFGGGGSSVRDAEW